MAQVFCPDANAGVGDVEHHLVAGPRDRERDVAASLRVAERVREEVGDDLLKASRVTQHPGRLDGGGEGNAGIGELRGE